MIAPKMAPTSDAHNTRPPRPPDRDPLSRRIHDLTLQERDAVRRRDWSSARVTAEERVALQAARQRAAARRLT